MKYEIRKTVKRDPETVSEIMSRVRSRDTAVEILFRKALWAKGLRYSLYSTKLPGKPDIVLPAKKTVVFIDGDYWHGGQWHRRKHTSLENQYMVSDQVKRDYWVDKIRRNMNRDCAATASLLSSGWQVIRFWESRIRDDIESCVEKVLSAIQNDSPPTPLAALPRKTFTEFPPGRLRSGLENQGWTTSPADPAQRAALATASLTKSPAALENLLETLKAGRPPLVLIDCPAAFPAARKGLDLKNALESLNELGCLVDAFFFTDADGAKRLFILAMLEDGNDFCRLESGLTLAPSDVRPPALFKFILANPQIKWSLRNLPKTPEKEDPGEWIARNYLNPVVNELIRNRPLKMR